jgi:hypothetical protein
VKFDFIATKEVAFPVEVMCQVLGVSRSGYYAWQKRRPSARAKADGQLAADIAAAHRRSRGTYGSPRVYAELRTKGRRVGRKRVESIRCTAPLVAKLISVPHDGGHDDDRASLGRASSGVAVERDDIRGVQPGP